MNLGKINHGDLLKEKNLWQVIKASQSIKDSPFNWIVGLLVSLGFFLYCLIESDTLRVHALLLRMAETGFNSAMSLLGFLIAGFTVFATLAKPELLLTMLKHRHQKSGLSYLKYNFFTLVRVFAYFLIFSAFQLSVIVLGQRDSIIAAVIKCWPDFQNILYWGNRFVLIVSAGLWAAVFLQLKSFVFNVHHIVMTMIKFEAVKHNEMIKKNGGS